VVDGVFQRNVNGWIYKAKQVVFQTKCNQWNNQYTIKLRGRSSTGGDLHVTCTSAGSKTVDTNNTVKCIDPVKFCKARFGGRYRCTESCRGNGRCQNRVPKSSSKMLVEENKPKTKFLAK